MTPAFFVILWTFIAGNPADASSMQDHTVYFKDTFNSAQECLLKKAELDAVLVVGSPLVIDPKLTVLYSKVICVPVPERPSI